MPRITLAPPLRTEVKTTYTRKKKEGAGNNSHIPTPPTPVGGGVGGGGCYPGPASRTTVKDVLNLAKELSADDAKTLLAQLALANQTPSNSEARDVQMWSQAVYEGLVKAHGGSGAGVPGPLVVQRSVGSSSSWGPVFAFVKAAGFDRLKVVERQAVYHFLADLVIKHATWVSRERGAPLSARLVANCSVNVAALFDQNFPGYLKAGLAHMVARSLISRH